MKNQQVIPDYAAMVKTSGTVLCLVLSGWVLFRLVQAVFWLPGHLEKTGGKLYERLDKGAKVNVTSGDQKQKKKKDKDSDDDEKDIDDDASSIAEEAKQDEDQESENDETSGLISDSKKKK
ncbi:uncharacterized protein LOC129753610 [Uranotaenia lowii]|uniref:uncharacterized protein LOC129753610 n=1 Tax=Uranotaenia lowii TaxID=190385 RepID=UPI00247854F6|nr:uncharacterized protein LOC129753610 [Uranotaenia lowii]